MTDDEWQRETYKRFLMVAGGAEDHLEFDNARELLRRFLEFWPDAKQKWEGWLSTEHGIVV